jgi:thiol-disulfide isomerase/thioredoxin
MKKIFATLALAVSFISANAQYSNDFIKIGQKAPDLAYANPEGKKIKLSDINKGSYVLLDFWASWCGPCRHSNPGLVRMYNEYSKKKFGNAPKGFTVVSVSLDKSKEAWVNAIQQDHLNWPNHMSDLGYWNSAAAASYGIQSIPQAFLIDPAGKIVGKYQAAEEAEADLRRLAK